MSNYTTTPPTKPWSSWKWVLVNGEYRFTEVSFLSGEHRDCLNEGETATSAGSFRIREREFMVDQTRSMTLNVGSSQEDWDAIGKLLNMSMGEG